MRINELSPIVNYNNRVVANNTKKSSNEFTKASVFCNSTKGIPFQAISGVKVKKNLNIDFEKNKLIKQIEKILQTQPTESHSEDFLFKSIMDSLTSFRERLSKQAEIMQQIEITLYDKRIKKEQKVDKIKMYEKQLKELKKSPVSTPQKKEKEINEKFDYELINKFKTSVMEDEYDLRKVYLAHYEDLKNISTYKELQERYPKIAIPKTPVEVISKKLVDNITRDFFKEVDWLCRKDINKALLFADKKIKEIFKELSEDCGLSTKFLYVNLAEEMHKNITKKLKTAHRKGFGIFPEQIKKNKTISNVDLKLLVIDFDKFVLSTIRAIYLDNKKPNEINFEDEELEIKISINELKGREYKFEKVDEKVKTLIKMAHHISELQRSYDYFSLEQLKSRLDYYSGTEIAENENLLEDIINFDSCLEADKESLICFLKELDAVKDDKKTITECLEYLKEHDIRPKEAEKINEKELEIVLEKKKEERQQTFILNDLKEKFDEAVNNLYSKNLSSIANICSKYRPQNLEQLSIDNAEFIIKTVKNSVQKDNINLSKLEMTIARWDLFNEYKSQNSEGEVFKNALKYGNDELGNLDINKAGQYIMNSEIIEMYPDSLELVKYPDLLSKIIEKTEGNRELAINYLAKLDAYQEFSDTEKSSIIKILEIFDSKDSIDKLILKHLIDNEYANMDTATIIDNGSETHKSSIKPSAKRAIIEKYMYPNCIDYLLDFEEALSSFGNAKGTSGIKQTGRNNNALEYKMELKLKRELDRLYSSKNDYNFDIYSEKGLH